MRSNRERLVELMTPWLEDYWKVSAPASRKVSDVVDKLAEVILAAGWRSQPTAIPPSRAMLEREFDKMFESLRIFRDWLDTVDAAGRG